VKGSAKGNVKGKGILDRLAGGVVLGDGGYIVELEQRGWVVTGAFTPEVALEHPGAIRELYSEMKNAGAEVLQVMAFYGSRAKLDTVGKGDKTREINEMATKVARKIAGGDVLVAGDLSTTWSWREGDADSHQLTARMLDEQIEAQVGVDFFIGETFHHLGEAKLCLERIKKVSGLPAMITMSFREKTTSRDGFTAGECAARLADAGADIVGANCMRDPERTYPIIEEMRAATDAYLAAQPVAYRCSEETPWFTGTSAFPDRLEPPRLTRYDMADFAKRARDMGVNYIGGCCGTGAVHLREMARALGKYRERPGWKANPDAPMSDTEWNWRRVHRQPTPGKRAGRKNQR
jgi:betaine-homocysteine S-methyltransferase